MSRFVSLDEANKHAYEICDYVLDLQCSLPDGFLFDEEEYLWFRNRLRHLLELVEKEEE